MHVSMYCSGTVTDLLCSLVFSCFSDFHSRTHVHVFHSCSAFGIQHLLFGIDCLAFVQHLFDKYLIVLSQSCFPQSPSKRGKTRRELVRSHASPGRANYPGQSRVAMLLLSPNIRETCFQHFQHKLQPQQRQYKFPTDKSRLSKNNTQQMTLDGERKLF